MAFKRSGVRLPLAPPHPPSANVWRCLEIPDLSLKKKRKDALYKQNLMDLENYITFQYLPCAVRGILTTSKIVTRFCLIYLS